MLPLYRGASIRALENAARNAHPGVDLMDNAGRAAAAFARRQLTSGARVLVLAGPGNNGGDAWVVALELARSGHRVAAVSLGDSATLPADAAAALARWRAAGGTVDMDVPDGPWDLIVDGLFGIGLTRDLEGRAAELVALANRTGTPILALDVPSGLDADTGVVHGIAVRARWTTTFLAAKPGLYTADGPDHAGTIVVEDLAVAAPTLASGDGSLLERDDVAQLLPARPRNSHKGTFGTIAVAGGAESMVGAVVLAAQAALLTGAGKVYAGVLGSAQGMEAGRPEIMWRSLDHLPDTESLDALVIGPGLGQSAAATAAVARAIAAPIPIVFDADALNCIAGSTDLELRLTGRAAPAILTPHPTEAARLLGCTGRDVQRDRIAAARTIATQLGCHVVLKGCGSICARPDGSWAINTSGNPGMASAGMGDTLAGMIGAFLGQGLSAPDAVALAVHLHGAAADALVARGVGPVGLTASEVAAEARALLNRWVYARTASDPT